MNFFFKVSFFAEDNSDMYLPFPLLQKHKTGFCKRNRNLSKVLSGTFASFACDLFCVMYSGPSIQDKQLCCLSSVFFLMVHQPKSSEITAENTSETTACSLFSPFLSCCFTPCIHTAGNMSDVLLHSGQL